MTCLDCMALGGLHDCASLLLGLFTVNFIMNPNLPCIAQTGRGVGTILLWDRMSNSQYVLMLKGWLE